MNAVPTPLTDPEIDILVGRYVDAMARYEETARLVEDRLRRALRANVVRALLGSRAKHPEDLRDKLARKRSDERYRFSILDARMNEVVTDLAGCRVMVYRFSDVENVERIVREALEVSSLPGSFERHRKESGYRASHFLVRIGDEVDRLSLRGAI
jgi:ppGpp synthetase/RelA/SpoT-type nucleotidyltranferase